MNAIGFLAIGVGAALDARLRWAIGTIGLHVGGSLLMTLPGILTIQRLAA